jgi:hypothetical protein
MLGRDAGSNADSRTALMAWVSAQPHRDGDPQAELVASRAEARLRELHPDAIGRYDALRAGLSPVEAMREVVPLSAGEQDRDSARQVYAPMLDRSTAPIADSKQALAAWTAALPLAETVPDAAQAAAAAEDRLRQLHPDALSRFDELRTSQTPDVALAEVTPLIDPASVTRAPNGPQSNAARAEEPEVRYAPAVGDALGAEVAGKVLRDEAWPALAGALHQAEQLGAHPTDLLHQVAGERELASAKSVAEVLHHRLEHRGVEQRTPTAADVAVEQLPDAPGHSQPADPHHGRPVRRGLARAHAHRACRGDRPCGARRRRRTGPGG